MILYFSATGNSKYVAERIAASLEDQAVSIEQQNPDITLKENEVLGIVTPTNWWELPILIREFIQKLKINAPEKPYIFVVSTYGTTAGASGSDAKHELKRRGYEMSAAFSIKMPDNWTPIFDLSNPEEVKKQNEDAEFALEQLIKRIGARELGNHQEHKTPYVIKPITNVFLNYERKTKHLYVEDSCIGCGLCAKKCPVQAIEIRDKKPKWVKDQCAMCLGCLHRCPKFAIQYGNGKTKVHGQYRNPNTRV